MSGAEGPAADINQLLSEYRDLIETYTEFAKSLETLLLGILKGRQDVILIQSRAKKVRSLELRLKRKPDRLSQRLSDIPDLAGLRLVLPFLSDVKAVGAIIEREFEVFEKTIRSAEEFSDEQQFGYLSDHYVVGLKEPRINAPEYQPFRDLRAEIQVRTALQHAWASVSHTLAYKREQSLPPQLQRRLARLAALFELGDDQFIALRQQTAEFVAAYETQLAQGDLEIPINSLSVDMLLETPELAHRMQEIAGAGGWREPEPRESFATRYRIAREELITVANELDFGTLESLKSALSDSRMEDFSRALRPRLEQAGWSSEATAEEVVARCLIGLQAAPEDDGLWLHPIYPAPVLSAIFDVRSRMPKVD